MDAVAMTRQCCLQTPRDIEVAAACMHCQQVALEAHIFLLDST